MITQYDVNSLLRSEIPQLAVVGYPSDISLEIYTSINRFTDYTKHALEEHNFVTLKKCFSLAEKLYVNGDKIVQFLIVNTFIYSFSSHSFRNLNEEFMVKSILPKSLYAVYRKQLMQKERERLL